MAYNLTSLLQDAYVRLGAITYYEASSGSTTTAVNTKTNITDTNLSGALFVRETTDNAAPEGEYSELSSFAPSTGTFTTLDTLTAAIGDGDIVGYATPLYPLQQMIELANMALSSLGRLEYVDTTTLDTAASQTEYSAAVLWKYLVTGIRIQTKTGDSNDNRWAELHGWRYVPAAAGSAGLIIFDHQPTNGRDLEITYLRKHPRVNSYSDLIHEDIDQELAVAALVAQAIEWLASRTQGNNPFLLQRLNDSRDQLAEAKAMFPVKRTPKKAKLLIVNE